MSKVFRTIINNKPTLINLANVNKVVLNEQTILISLNGAHSGILGFLIAGSGFIEGMGKKDIELYYNTKEEAEKVLNEISQLM
jgi:hypothetical protein